MAGRDESPETGPNALIWLLRRSVRRYRGPVVAALVDSGITDLAQPGIWAVAALGSGCTSASELVDCLSASKQSVSQLVENLVASGYVARDADPSDRRRQHLVLTGRGEEALAVIDAAIASVDGEFAVRLGGPQQLRALVKLLRQADAPAAPRPGGTA